MVRLFFGFHPIGNLYRYQHGVGYSILFDHFKVLLCAWAFAQDGCCTSKYCWTEAERKGGVVERRDDNERNRLICVTGRPAEEVPLTNVFVVCLRYPFGQACCPAGQLSDANVIRIWLELSEIVVGILPTNFFFQESFRRCPPLGSVTTDRQEDPQTWEVGSDFIDHVHIIEFLADGHDDALCVVEFDLMLDLSPPVPRQTHHRDGAKSVQTKVKIGVVDGIHQIENEEIPIPYAESVQMERQAIGALLELLPGDLRLLVDNGEFAWKDLGISIQQVEDGQVMPQPLGRISLTLFLGEGVPAFYQFSVRLLPCHSCHSLPCHLGDLSAESHPKHFFLMGQ